MISATLVAYGFARFRFPRNALFMLVIATLMLPPGGDDHPELPDLQATSAGWTRWLPLIVPSWFGGGAFYIFLLRQFFLTLPRDLDEAAKIDGANSLRILWQILVPLSMPALTTVAIFTVLRTGTSSSAR